MPIRHFAAACGLLAALPLASAYAIGLAPAQDWMITSGRCTTCSASPQALWYFQDQHIAVPARPADAQQPPLVWLGGPQVFAPAQLQGEQQLVLDGQPQDWQLVTRLSTNRSWFNEDSQRWLSGRPLSLRGQRAADGRLTVHAIWPQDQSLPQAAPQPLQAGESLQSLVRQQADGPFAARVLWQRKADWRWQPGQPVLGLMLNGAQGDDDEALGGHFAVVTGRTRPDGQMSDWLVNNFYNLDSVSEKGILAAPVPLDTYMGDLNSGQSWYRPSWMLVAVLRQDRGVRAWQQDINRVYDEFYRHDLLYDHARSNCSGISMDSLRNVGWQIPERGPGGRLKSVAAWFYAAASDGSLRSGRKIYDYLQEEQTRLYPAVAFDAAGNDLLALASGSSGRPLSRFEQELVEDIEAIVWLRLPQIPSSRAAGAAPVYSLDEYLQRTPSDRSQWKIVPVAPRPFPAHWREQARLQPGEPAAVPWPVALLLTAVLLTPLLLLWRWWRRRRAAA